ncbi:MAG: glycosyltransferase family 4 protein, partial [Candidatus Nanoarchaeia archaeon]
PNQIPECDFIVATTPDEVMAGVSSGKAKKKVVHLCQGFEVEDLEERIQGKILPSRYQGNGFFKKLTHARKKLEWKKRIAELNKIYSLDTLLIVISQHLKNAIEKRYSRKAELCRYGVKKQFFFPSSNPIKNTFSKDSPCRIINIGPVSVTFKGIPDTLEAIRILKGKGLPIHFIRVSPDEKKDEDISAAQIIDEYYQALSPQELGNLLRTCDIYISNSLEGEGFGLPAMEAMSCGLICVLSSISSYLDFDPIHDYAIFVPERMPQATANAVEKILSMPLNEKQNMIQRAIEVSEKYSFDKTLEQLRDIILRSAGCFKSVQPKK